MSEIEFLPTPQYYWNWVGVNVNEQYISFILVKYKHELSQTVIFNLLMISNEIKQEQTKITEHSSESL